MLNICISTNKETYFINPSNILYVSGENNYSVLHVLKKDNIIENIISSKSLVHYEKLLSQDSFYRLHNRFIVNLFYINYYDKINHEVKLKSGISIPVSFRKKKEFLQKMSEVST